MLETGRYGFRDSVQHEGGGGIAMTALKVIEILAESDKMAH